MSGILQLINTFPSGGFAVKNSLRFRSSASAYLNRTPASAGSQTTWTWSGWVKRGAIGTSSRQVLFGSVTGTSDSTWLEFGFQSGSSDQFFITTYNSQAYSTSVYRDPSAWYHVQVAFDTTQATSTDRIKIYINGVQISLPNGSFVPTQNANYGVNAAQIHWVGGDSSAQYFDGYMAEVNFIDGQALTPSSFGAFDATSGVWQPVKYSGTYGTNGFYLKFTDTTSTTTLCYDYSGNSNNWTPNNISLTSGSTYDSMLDSPTNYDNGGNGVGNYAVMNPLDTSGSTTNANLSVSTSGFSGYGTTRATFGMSSGKWYWEVTPTSFGDGGTIGVATAAAAISSQLGANVYGWGYLEGGSKYNNASATSYGASYTTNDVIGVAFDADAGTLTFYKNNTSQGVAFSGLTSGPYFPAVSDNGGGTTGSVFAVTFGQRPFSYTPPTGYKALNTQNLPAGIVITSGSFTGNASIDGPFVWLNGLPTAMTINGNAVTFGTDADKLANGFKIRSSSSSYNSSGTNTYSITTTGAVFKYQIAQPNP
jgi:hypothetical protein